MKRVSKKELGMILESFKVMSDVCFKVQDSKGPLKRKIMCMRYDDFQTYRLSYRLCLAEDA